jgi:hypothetical protein
MLLNSGGDEVANSGGWQGDVVNDVPDLAVEDDAVAVEEPKVTQKSPALQPPQGP